MSQETAEEQMPCYKLGGGYHSLIKYLLSTLLGREEGITNVPWSLTKQNEGQALPNLYQPEDQKGGDDPTEITHRGAYHHPKVPGEIRTTKKMTFL